jgi:IclR family transcriptional regulator, pca regulon regulatory protein
VSVHPIRNLAVEKGGERSELVTGFSRGMAVIRCFSAATPSLTIAEVARAADLNRSTARRLLRTLEAENYVGFRSGRYFLRPGILELGYSYLSATSVDDLLQGRLFEVAEQVRESCTAAVLDGHDAMFVARAQTTHPRVTMLALTVGTRVPAYLTAAGRVLLAYLGDDELEDYLSTETFRRATPRTVANGDDLRRHIRSIRDQGYCILDQEIELGMRACAVPVHRPNRPPLAISISSHASRGTVQFVRQNHLPALEEAARELEKVFTLRH